MKIQNIKKFFNIVTFEDSTIKNLCTKQVSSKIDYISILRIESIFYINEYISCIDSRFRSGETRCGYECKFFEKID